MFTVLWVVAGIVLGSVLWLSFSRSTAPEDAAGLWGTRVFFGTVAVAAACPIVVGAMGRALRVSDLGALLLLSIVAIVTPFLAAISFQVGMRQIALDRGMEQDSLQGAVLLGLGCGLIGLVVAAFLDKVLW